MPLRQKLKIIIKRARSISELIIRSFISSAKWVLTSFVVVFLIIGAAIAGAVRAVYRTRSKIVGTALLVSIVTALLLWTNLLLSFNTDRIHDWLVLDYHWAIIAGAISFLILTTWDYVSPTLRALFSWGRIGICVLVGMALVVAAYADLPKEDIAYRSAYVGATVLYVVILAVMAKKPPKDFVSPKSPYIEDSPVGHDVQDYETQKRVIADIKYLVTDGRPSVFAITGRWGVGKSFLLDKVEKSFKQDKKVIWMKFEPWRYASEEALIRGFYQDIGTTLAKAIPGIQNITQPLVQATDKFIRQHDGTGILGTIMDVARTISQPAEGPEAQIQELLTRERKRLVIAIDDVERSFDAERIFRTLQLAHYAKNMKNVQVVFLCDKDVVLRARPDHFGDPTQDATEYLEKFVEREVSVPSPQPPELRRHFAALMEAHRDKPGFDFSDDDLPEEMLTAIGTPRGIIRLFNEFAAFRVNLEGGDNEPR